MDCYVSSRRFADVLLVLSLFLANLTYLHAKDFPYSLCSNITTDDSRSSIFAENLESLFSQFSSNASTYSELNRSVGDGRDRIYGQYMCLSYVSSSDCQECVKQAFENVQKLCPNDTEAILWREPCQIRYSKKSFVGRLDVSGNIPLANKENASDERPFRRAVEEDVRVLINKAAFNASSNKSASGQRRLNSTAAVYALAQCTTDLNGQQCKKCLTIAMDNLTTVYYSARGARLLSRSCFLRYELYNFYTNQSSPTLDGDKTEDNSGGGLSDKHLKIALIALAVGVAIVLLALIIRWRYGRDSTYMIGDWSNLYSSSPAMDMASILRATNNFSKENFLGRGEFGPVYRGILRRGVEVAVKRLSHDSSQGLEQFESEELLMKLKHKNLVRLLGFCVLGAERLLVYEFMPNGSLEGLLLDPERRRELDWTKRVKIIKHIARGLLYLHQYSCHPIIHRDLKPGNILLDKDLNPKISDFGTARAFSGYDQDIKTNIAIGTIGYMAPEYINQGIYSIKSDVFSFGVLLMEIITGNAEFHHSDLLIQAWYLWNEGDDLELKDELLTDPQCFVEFSRLMHIGLLCVQQNSDDRPTMLEVESMLNNNEGVNIAAPGRPPCASSRRGRRLQMPSTTIVAR